MRIDGFPAFCAGCEFAGDTAVDTPLERGSAVFDPGTNSSAVYYIDSELRFSAGIVRASQPAAPLAIQDGKGVGNIIRSCRNGRSECKLGEAGFVPVELTLSTKRKLVASYVNSLSGIMLLGRVEFAEQD